MHYFKKDIIVNTESKSDYIATLQAYIPESPFGMDDKRVRPAVLVLPGGGYSMTSDRENEPIALKLASEGICAFVLKYSVAPARFPQALCEALTSLKYIREIAGEYSIDTDNISVCGFSAGGHLAASVGVFWNRSFIADHIGEFGSCMRPNKLILAYPVIKTGDYIHQGSINNLLGEVQTEDQLELVSLEKQISEDTPPSFIWHTFDDNVVPVQNSLVFATELAAKNIPLELHVYKSGDHGLSLGNHIVDMKRVHGVVHESSDWIVKAIRFIYD